tara:strand:+ start:3088 stop:3336 length:249 start_codon:yes stop_codon:yes gene_type:complete
LKWFPIVFMVFSNPDDRMMYIFQWPFNSSEECVEFSVKNKEGLFFLAHKAYEFKINPLNLICVSEEGIEDLQPRLLEKEILI